MPSQSAKISITVTDGMCHMENLLPLKIYENIENILPLKIYENIKGGGISAQQNQPGKRASPTDLIVYWI